jgi:deoxyribodipyrimidine photolyase-related protein
MKSANDQKKILRLILGDQLNINHSWYKEVNHQVIYVLMELKSETDYAIHHIQKVTAFFAAMQAFCALLSKHGHCVLYIKLNDPENKQSFSENCNYLIKKHSVNHFQYQLPDEYRLDELLKNYSNNLQIPFTVFNTEHFFSSRNELGEFFKNKKTYVMESFYRHMRKKHCVLMEGDEPISGKWNYDEENRKKLPANHKAIAPLVFNNNVKDIVSYIDKSNIKTIGKIDAENFIWPINRKQSLELMHFFVQHCLPLFGTYQDAMTPEDWSLYHSRLSFSLNCKLISPLEVINQAIEEWKKRPNEIDYNQVEGFVRQIIGWREYMRGIYWLKMPQYAELNYFNHFNNLPDWYWTGKTKMNCLKHTIIQSLNYAYAHHIQRLMITGNFALLAGVHPDEVDKWYLGIYIDAIDWVEITNTRGMSQFADGGIVGTKPYVSSATYIDKMSHYCKSCYYNKAKKTGDKACPFNSLYWNFYARNENKLSGNPRIGMMYNIWHKMKPETKAELLIQADYYLKHINEL